MFFNNKKKNKNNKNALVKRVACLRNNIILNIL